MWGHLLTHQSLGNGEKSHGLWVVMRTCMCAHTTRYTTHHTVKTNAAMDFHGALGQAAFGPHEAWVSLLLLLPTCFGTLEMPFYSLSTKQFHWTIIYWVLTTYEALSRGWGGLIRKHLTLIRLDAGGVLQLGAVVCAHQRGTSLLQESRGRGEVMSSWERLHGGDR